MGRRTAENMFPSVLHEILQQAQERVYEDVVSWNSSGRSFKVHDRDRFVADVLPLYAAQTKYKSFVRQLNLWGFSCIHGGRKAPERGSYHHPYFVRDSPDMCLLMKRMKVKGKILRQAALGAVADGNASSDSRRQSCTTTMDESKRSLPMLASPFTSFGFGRDDTAFDNSDGRCMKATVPECVSDVSLTGSSGSDSSTDSDKSESVSTTESVFADTLLHDGCSASPFVDERADVRLENASDDGAVGRQNESVVDGYDRNGCDYDEDLFSALADVDWSLPDVDDRLSGEAEVNDHVGSILLSCNEVLRGSIESFASTIWPSLPSFRNCQRRDSDSGNGPMFIPIETDNSDDDCMDPVVTTDNFWNGPCGRVSADSVFRLD